MAKNRTQPQAEVQAAPAPAPEAKSQTARQLLNDCLRKLATHPDVKLLITGVDGIPRQHEMFPETRATKQHIAEVKLIFRDPE